MAKANPKTRPPKQERILTISTATYEPPDDGQLRSIEFYRCHETRPCRTVPFIRLKGKWLEEAGFQSNQQVRVGVSAGRLVITPK
ncbi:MAG TPA: SymE family type I addiction module toxin [Pseudoxanthomonas sp.]|jgi:hypothetical protein|nr:SymE family type I addiction module toxin [Pseudoxanthomonas sp.]